MNPATDAPFDQRFEAALADYLGQVDRGARPDRRSFLAAHPDLAEDLADYFEVQDRMERLAVTWHGGQPTFGVGAGAPPRGAAHLGPPDADRGGVAHGRDVEEVDLRTPRHDDPRGAAAPGAAAAGGGAGREQHDGPGREQHGGAGHELHGGTSGGAHGAHTDDAPLPEGSLLGQYRLQRVLGEGGMGRVYVARHHHLDRTVAIKVLAPRFSRDGALVQRFHREAQALARLGHPNIVAIHDMGSQGDVHFFVMEHVEGDNLRQLMSRGPLRPSRALTLVSQICGALQYAHDQGVVHRDIKPENILLDPAGQPKVADFGLAKVLQEEVEPANLTRTDMVLGTYNYMAPEQKHSARVDHRADVYALGVVLYEMLTGKLPVGHFVLPSRSGVTSPGVDDVVLKALASEPERRYQRASDFGSDCASVLAGRGAPGALGAPPVQAPPAELVVVDATTDVRIGGCAAAWLRLVAKGDDELHVRAWSKDVIAVQSDGKLDTLKLKLLDAPSGPWAGDSILGRPGLQLRVPKDDTTVYVPEGLPVTVSGDEVELSVSGLRAPLRVEPGKGKLHVRDHRGRLEIDRLDDGQVSVEGLVTSDVRISTRAGRLAVAGLAMTSGRGTLHTDDGNLTLGLDVERCSLRLSARSLSGSVSSELAQFTLRGASFLEGHLERGAATLELDSYSGKVRLASGLCMLRTELARKTLEQLGPMAIWVAIALWADWGWIGWAMVVWWGSGHLRDGLGSLWKLIRSFGPEHGVSALTDRHGASGTPTAAGTPGAPGAAGPSSTSSATRPPEASAWWRPRARSGPWHPKWWEGRGRLTEWYQRHYGTRHAADRQREDDDPAKRG